MYIRKATVKIYGHEIEKEVDKTMENKNSERSFLGIPVKEEKTTISNGDEEGASAEINKAILATTTDQSATETNTDGHHSPPNSTLKNQEDQLKSAKAEMGEVREENERLKVLLAKIVKEYQSLQTHFYDILQQEEAKKPKETTTALDHTHQENEEPELVSLSLGKTSSDQPKKDEKKASNNMINNGKDDEEFDGGLALGLGYRFEPARLASEILKNNSSSDNSLEELNKEDEQTDRKWSPSKLQKTTKNGDHDEVSQQAALKRARVSVRARCDAPTMNDGCQWRKYGQKIAKGNPCPRAYYRCTVSPNCPVRKQVQRCAEDMSILITTYEGTHDHPLPISATAMASTTSAAASMLQSCSSTSQPGGFMNSSNAPLMTTSSTPSNNTIHGFNFTSLHNSKSMQQQQQQQYYFPNSSISTSNAHPTITLDLTAPNSNSRIFSSPFSSAPRFSSTSLNFSSSSSSSLDFNNLKTPWMSNQSSYFNYGSNAPYNQSKNQSGLLNNNGKRPIFQEPAFMMNNVIQNASNSQQSLTETIAAATKAIASNPKFQSALAAALTTVVGNSGNGVGKNQGGADQGSTGMSLKWGNETSTVNSLFPAGKNGIGGCGSSCLNKSSNTMNSQQLQQGNNLNLLPPTLSLSTSKSASLSPTENNRDL